MRVTFAHIHGNHKPGGTAEVEDNDARQLIHDGIAVAAAADPGASSVDQVIADVGDDPALAAEALAAEQARAKPRKTLVTALEAIAGPDPTTEV